MGRLAALTLRALSRIRPVSGEDRGMICADRPYIFITTRPKEGKASRW